MLEYIPKPQLATECNKRTAVLVTATLSTSYPIRRHAAILHFLQKRATSSKPITKRQRYGLDHLVAASGAAVFTVLFDTARIDLVSFSEVLK